MALIPAKDWQPARQEHEQDPRMCVQQDNTDPSCIQGEQALCLVAAVSPPNANRELHAGKDGSDGEDDDHLHGKIQRTGKKHPGKSTAINGSLPCPFRVRYPNLCECKSLKDWQRFREHLIIRTHKPRDQCPNCGEIFGNSDQRDQHTRARSCQSKPQEEFDSLMCYVTRDQESKIRALRRQGTKTHKSFEESWRETWDILFEGEPCTVWPYSNNVSDFQYVDNLGTDSQTFLGDEDFQKMVSGLPGMEHVPRKDRGHLAIEWYRGVHSYFSGAGKTSVGEHPSDDAQFQQSAASSPVVHAPHVLASHMDFPAGGNAEQNNSMSGSCYLDGATDTSQTDLSSFLFQYSQGSFTYFDPTSAESQPGEPVDNFDSNSFRANPSLLEMTNLQYAPPSLLIDSSSRPPNISSGPPGSEGHQEDMAVNLELGQGQYLSPDELAHAGDLSDGWPGLNIDFDMYHLPSDGGHAEQNWA